MATKQENRSDTATYVYGIVPAAVEINPDARGIGDPPQPVTVVRHGDVAALVTEIHPDHPLGEPAELTAHAGVLDATIAEVPVLPMRFGAVVTGQDAVAEELLAPFHDEFRDALAELDGLAQYVIKGRYDEQAILGEVLAESADAAQLRDAIRDKPADATRNERIALGELITNVITAKRDADTEQTLKALQPLDIRVSPREPTHERDAVHLAVLARLDGQPDLEQVIGDLAERWRGRIDLRLLGPLAPYDFIAARQPEG